MAIYIPQPDDDVVPQSPPKFFKIITNPEADALRIPVEFMKRFGQGLPDNVFLKAPGGLPWKVSVFIKSNGESWLRNGWNNFKDHYAIKFGHMVEFAYNGDSVFDVTIFDMTTTEINYCMYNANNTSSMLITHGNILLQRSRPASFKANSVCHKGKAYEKAQAFKAKNISPQSLSFACLLRPSSTAPRYELYIPIPIVRKFSCNGHHVVKLNDSSGRTWSAKCKFRERGGYMFSGWKEFVKDNALELGDACVIELDKKNKLVWNITTFRNRNC